METAQTVLSSKIEGFTVFLKVKSIQATILLLTMFIWTYFILQAIVISVSPVTVAPTWVGNAYVQAGSKRIVNGVKTGSNLTPTSTIVFTTAFTTVPNLVYGISDYEGDDSLRDENFQVNRTTLTTTSFSVLVQISGVTNIWVLGIRYFSIAKSFPHHLNTFHYVPINYNKGALTNLTTSTLVTNTYTNTINYTAQAIASGYTYRSFSLPVTNCKIVLYLTTLFEQGPNDSTNPPLYPLNLTITPTILTNQTYKLVATYSIKAVIRRLCFSMIVYDEKDIQSSYAYQIVSFRVDLPTTGGSISIPSTQFHPTTMVGWVEFSTNRTTSVIHFNLNFMPTGEIFMPASTPRHPTYTAFNRFQFTVFYIKTWGCATSTFFNISSNLCVSCPVPHCITCLNINQCQTCDTANGYQLKPNATSIDKQCSLCNDANCLACPNRSVCVNCDASTNYFEQAGSCVLCNLSNCVLCENLTACITCDSVANYVIDPATKLCIPCTIANCIDCINSTFCGTCDEANNYFFNSTSSLCSLCAIPNCVLCSNLTQCNTCDQPNNYFLVSTTNVSAQCQLCNIPNCISCLSLSVCSTCNQTNNYFSNPSPTNATDQCIVCPVSNCLLCTNITTCQTCNETSNHFLNLTDFQCNLCTLTGCLECANMSACSTCNNSANYFLNSTTLLCVTCNVPYCLQCDSIDTCQTCDASINYFNNPTPNSTGNSACIYCPVTGCNTCATFSTCLTCSNYANYFLNATDSTCILCSLANCVLCASLTGCQTCNQAANFFLNPSTLLCEPCSISNCLICRSLTSCLTCDAASNYFVNPSTGQCQIGAPVCGDNIFLPPQQCDDGNLQDGDGCSASCSVETDWTCEPNSAGGMANSVCFYTGLVSMRVVYIEKVDDANQIEILLEVTPLNAKFWDSVDFASMVSLSNMTSFDSYAVRRNSDGTVSILINYHADIHNMNITVELDPTKSGKLALSRLSSSFRSFPVLPSDNEVAIYYDANFYGMSRMVSILAYIIAGLSLFFFLLGIFARKLVSIEMVAVVQISYLSLLTLPSLNPSFKALTNMWFVNGFSYFSLSKNYLKDTYSPLQAKGIFLYSRFTENYNFTLLLILLPYLLSLISYILSKTLYKRNQIKKDRAVKWARIFACESAFNGIMFSGYIIAVSFALEVIYGTKNMAGFIGILSIMECCVLLLLYAVYFFLIIKFQKYFGEFVYQFKKRKVVKDQEIEKGCCTTTFRKWYNILMIERILVGSCLVLLLSMELSPLVAMGLFLILAILTIIVRPYLRMRHNVRFACNMLVCIIIEGIYYGYKKATVNDRNKQLIWLAMPMIICILLLICIVYNVFTLIYDFCKRNIDSKSELSSIKEQEDIANELGKEMMNMNLSLTTNPLIETKRSGLSPDELKKFTDEDNRQEELGKIRDKLKAELMTTRKQTQAKNIFEFSEPQTEYFNQLSEI